MNRRGLWDSVEGAGPRHVGAATAKVYRKTVLRKKLINLQSKAIMFPK